MNGHKVYQIKLATNDTESHLNIYFRDSEKSHGSYCLTPDSARILRDGLLEFYPLPVQEAQTSLGPQRFEAHKDLFSDKWVVKRVIHNFEHVVDCANEADALQVAGVLNGIKVF